MMQHITAKFIGHGCIWSSEIKGIGLIRWMKRKAESYYLLINSIFFIVFIRLKKCRKVSWCNAQKVFIVFRLHLKKKTLLLISCSFKTGIKPKQNQTLFSETKQHILIQYRKLKKLVFIIVKTFNNQWAVLLQLKIESLFPTCNLVNVSNTHLILSSEVGKTLDSVKCDMNICQASFRHQTY